MERFLVTLSLGPVQSLIGAARRTRDLWCGSWLLSEAARAAARVLHQGHPGCLIFPCPEDPDTDLMRQDKPGDAANAANIANVLRAEIRVPDASAARVLCEAAKSAAVSRLTELGDDARTEMAMMGRPVREEVWQAQIGDVLEGFAAWVSIVAVGDDGCTDGDAGGGYAKASRRLGGVLAARKATRDFQPCEPLPVEGLPKSSLDGALETVLPDDWPVSDRARRKLRLSKGEHLDALGVMKRLAGDSDQFTAYSRVAVDPWIEQLTPEQQQRLRAAYEPLVGLELATRTTGNDGIYAALPFDAQMLYGFRLDNALSEAHDEPEASRALRNLRDCVTAISRYRTGAGKSADARGKTGTGGPAGAREKAGKDRSGGVSACAGAVDDSAEPQEKAGNSGPVGVPVPYAAILKADGDRMGKFLSRADRADRARAISQALHVFASGVHCIVREHRGHAIYAGGDDVLALVPLAQALDCSRKLADAFRDSLHEIATEMGVPDDERPTLSVGLGIGHLMEPLGALRARAEGAEHAAKEGGDPDTARNALAIVLGIRSGAERCWRAQWSDKLAFRALDCMTGAFRRDLLPTRAAYDLQSIDLRLAWLRGDDGPRAVGMRSADVRRLLDRARIRGGAGRIPGDLKDLIVERARKQPLKKLADTMIVARWLSARTAGDLGERT